MPGHESQIKIFSSIIRGRSRVRFWARYFSSFLLMTLQKKLIMIFLLVVNDRKLFTGINSVSECRRLQHNLEVIQICCKVNCLEIAWSELHPNVMSCLTLSSGFLAKILCEAANALFEILGTPQCCVAEKDMCQTRICGLDD